MQAMKMERRLELAMEGHRFFDLRRWGEAETVMNDYLAVESTRRQYLTAAFPYTSRHDMFPIPSRQLELSAITNDDGTVDERLVQNPGW